MYVSECSEKKCYKKKRPIEIAGLYMRKLAPTKNMDHEIRTISFIEAPNKTIASQKNCKKTTFRININSPEARPSFPECNCRLSL